ncbi:MAG: type transport system permease protein [Thermoplasmata archaeon]|jgi:ABC-2 type transport system permease protein|nr:type transport system permease protein [Thermoplasmata archaeon]
MIRDALSVAWKEWRELVRARTTRIGALVIVVIFGVVLPLNGRVEESRSPFQAITWAVIPFALTIPIISDAIAGERERHTLETLLASRLTELDILAGKIGTSVVYAFGGSLVVMVMQIAVWSGRAGTFTAPPVDVMLAGLLAALGVALVAASAGVLVSLRAQTVRQAQQILGLSFAALYVAGIVLFQLDALADARRSLLSFLTREGPTELTLVVALVLLAVAAALLVACRAAFQRQKLLLD